MLLTLAFPEGGYAPFPFTSYVTIPISCAAALMVLPRSERDAARGAPCSTRWASTLAIIVPTAMGGNAARLGLLVAGPLLACALAGRLRRPVTPIVVLLLALLVWQLSPAARDVYKAATDPVAKASYFDPVREYLRLLPDQRRVEIPFTLGHWEGAEVGSDFPMARGWLRQLDTGRNPIFYKGNMSQLAYANWLSENAVRYVALPDAKPDNSAYREVALIERGLPYLRLRASFEHWRIYEVTLPAPVVIPRGGRGHRAGAAGLGPGAAARAQARLGAGARALDALLAGQGRLRGARRRLDARDRHQARLPEAGHPLRARAGVAAREALQHRLSRSGRQDEHAAVSVGLCVPSANLKLPAELPLLALGARLGRR